MKDGLDPDASEGLSEWSYGELCLVRLPLVTTGWLPNCPCHRIYLEVFGNGNVERFDHDKRGIYGRLIATRLRSIITHNSQS